MHLGKEVKKTRRANLTSLRGNWNKATVVHGAFTESAHALATASLFTTLRREERLQSQPVRLQDARTLPLPIPRGIKEEKAKTRDVVAAKEKASLNHREENHLQVNWIDHLAEIISRQANVPRTLTVHIGTLHRAVSLRMEIVRRLKLALSSIVKNPQPCLRRRNPPKERGDLLRNHL